jgi:hypothetical protein
MLVVAGPAGAAVTGAPGWIAGAMPLPGVNASDVAPVGSALLVGIGAYGAQGQSIVRVERDGTSTTLVTQLNAIGGLAYDAENDLLLFTDNGLDAPPGTAVTGDTLYALPDPLGAPGPVSAATLELAPSGSIGFAQAVLPLPGGDVLIGDAAGFGGGRVVRYSAGNLTNLVTGLDFTAGVSLALTPANELLVGDVDSATFAGSVERYDLAGNFLGTLVGGLSGSYDQAVTAAGNLLLTGGFTGDFSSSTVLSTTPAGATSEIATGFGFSSGIAIDPQSQQALVLDFGTSHVDTLTPVAALTAGGTGRKECQTELWGGAFDVAGNGRALTRWTCADGGACDRDGEVNGSCLFVVGTCFSVSDPRLPSCTPEPIDGAVLRISKSPPELAEMQAKADAVLPSTGAVCSEGTEVTVAARKTFRVGVRARVGSRTADSDNLALRCLAAQ